MLLLVVPVTLAARRIVPNAMRLGRRTDPLPEQMALARSIWRDHIMCFASMLLFLVLQLV